MPKKKYELVIFDWDGTIIDSQAHIIYCMQQAIADAELPQCEHDAIRHIIGLSLNKAIATLFPELSMDRVEYVADRYRHHFFLDPANTSPLFSGAEDVIRDLHAKGYYLAVATGKGRKGLDIALQTTGLEPFFHVTRCADETRSKPDPLMLDEILTDLDMPCEKAVMVGDTSYDLDMAHNMRMDSVAVTYGMHEAQLLESSHPTYMIDSIDQLPHYV